MILVFFRHLGDSWFPALAPVFTGIYTFHMPLFFVLSGLFFNPRMHFVDLVGKRAKTLLIPYYVFSVFALIGPMIKLLRPQLYTAAGKSAEVHPLTVILNIVFAQGNSGLWFLWALFVAFLALWLLVKITRGNPPALLIVLLVFIGVNFAINQVPEVPNLPFQLSKIFEATAYVGFGYLLANTVDIKKIHPLPSIKQILQFVVLFATFIVMEHFYPAFPLVSRDNPATYVFAFLITITGIAFAISMSLLLPTIPWLTAIGQFRLVFYSLNDVALKIVKFVLFSVGHVPIATFSFSAQLLMGILIVSIALVLCYWANEFIQHHAKWITGTF
ncbi:MAG: acyltransferase family protein [Bifidobacterium tibiigranuli]|jgi:fucose 4-O-acetylase-like acetyltransferase|uniref:acyltransferase family protein n=1 Tax=Bifidobacterium tibiigranuli TaxID=2172043 RepID=UPI0026F34ECC|nr:acyltransferase family protein [Bifidobacterium tibiigranuli]MCI2186558.1 acyltransferase family protein [Bifidobacterium tibiigranuli]